MSGWYVSMSRVLSRIRALGWRAGAAGLLATLAGVGGLLVVSAAGAASGSELSEVQARAQAPAGAKALGVPSSSTTETGLVVLRPRDEAGIKSFIAAATKPHSATYHHYLAKGAYAARFGPASGTISAVESQLKSDGLTVSGATSDGLMVRFSGTAKAVESAFDTSLESYRLANGTTGTGTTAAVRLPSSIAGDVEGVIGLNSLTHDYSGAVRPVKADISKYPKAKAAAVPHIDGAPSPCSDASTAATTFGGLTDDQIANAYGASALYGEGDTGAGVHIGVYELEPFDETDLQTFDQCYFGDSAASQMASNLQVIPVDGGQPAGPGSGESILDVEDVSAMAPGADIDVYEAPNTNAGSLDEYASIIDADNDQIVTSSWGDCEELLQSLDPGAEQAENYLFEQAAAQGQTILNATGDTGSDGCNESRSTPPDIANENPLSAGDPASQPYVLGVAGTTLQDASQPPLETVWNDGAVFGGGNGGLSEAWTAPSWQIPAFSAADLPGGADYTNAASVENSTNTNDGTDYPPDFCEDVDVDATSSTPCRGVPDVAADADEFTGAVTIYQAVSGGWTTIGGTSSATPIWAAMLALVDSSSTCQADGETSIGFASPLLYAVAANPAEYAESFNDVSSGNNDTDGLDNGLVFPARTGYDLATGLGSPELTDAGGTAGLAANLCNMAASGTRPAITGVSVNTTSGAASTAGGDTLTITGSNLDQSGTDAVSSVTVGDDSISSVTPVSGGVQITLPPAADTLPSPGTGGVEPPQDGAGPAEVTVTLGDGESSALSSVSKFDYVDPATTGTSPAVNALSPTAGNEKGTPGPVKIYGAGFTGTPTVTFGGKAASDVTVVSSDELLATPPVYSNTVNCAGHLITPPGQPTKDNKTNDICQVNVQVTVGGNTSATSTILPPYEGPALVTTQDFVPEIPTGCKCEIATQPTEYDYAPTPTITGVSTSQTPTPDPGAEASEDGGVTVEVDGTGFDPLVYNWSDFGDPGQASSMGPAPTYQSGTVLDLTAPETAGVAAGGSPTTDSLDVPLSIDSLVGQSATGSSVTYAGVPVVTGVALTGTNSPTAGPDTGGSPLTITGILRLDSTAAVRRQRAAVARHDAVLDRHAVHRHGGERHVDHHADGLSEPGDRRHSGVHGHRLLGDLDGGPADAVPTGRSEGRRRRAHQRSRRRWYRGDDHR
jgi:hypothetical protein